MDYMTLQQSNELIGWAGIAVVCYLFALWAVSRDDCNR